MHFGSCIYVNAVGEPPMPGIFSLKLCIPVFLGALMIRSEFPYAARGCQDFQITWCFIPLQLDASTDAYKYRIGQAARKTARHFHNGLPQRRQTQADRLQGPSQLLEEWLKQILDTRSAKGLEQQYQHLWLRP